MTIYDTQKLNYKGFYQLYTLKHSNSAIISILGHVMDKCKGGDNRDYISYVFYSIWFYQARTGTSALLYSNLE